MSVEIEDQIVLSGALEASGDAIYEWDLESDAIRWHGPAAAVFELDDVDPIASGDLFHSRINSEDLKQRLRLLSRHFGGDPAFDCEYRVRTGTGGFCWVHERGRLQTDPASGRRRMRGMIRCVTDRKRSDDRLEYLANYDELTGYFNRSRLRQAVEHALASSRSHGRTGAYLVIDIDNISMVNDAFSFEIGDEVVVALAERLDVLVGTSDMLGRLDGDSFGLLLDDGDELHAGAVAERIVRSVRAAPMKTTVGDIAITVTVGGVVFPDSAQTAYDVMARAEVALTQAKKSGRNHFLLYRLTEMQRDTLRHNMSIAKEVQEALTDGRLMLSFQPIVNSGDGKTSFYECLLRMRRLDGEIMVAGRFVPVVEQLGLMRQIDRRTLELAVQELANDPDVVLALNISGLTATDRNWLRSLVTLLRGKEELARRLIVEITETAALQDIEESARFVTAVRELGCRVALDDFGAGYSSFRHLKALPVDMVKIDGQFVAELAESEENRLFIRTLIGLAAGFGLETVAECVETENQAELLRAEGVTFMQGWHFGKPELERPGAPVKTQPGALIHAFPTRLRKETKIAG